MSANSPLQISRWLLLALGTRMFVHHQDRLPSDGPVLVVSNHRSFMDAPLLMSAIQRPIRFACHHYMSQVPVMREVVEKLGCFPLEPKQQGQQSFFYQATQFLQTQQAVGLFPEGGEPMVQLTHPATVGDFHRGFAHLALRAPVSNLMVLPVAIAAFEEDVNSAVPLKFLSFFDPSEPLFAQDGWHPMVVYRRVNILIGRPYWVKDSQREHYQGKEAKTVVADLTQYCQLEIDQLVRQGYY